MPSAERTKWREPVTGEKGGMGSVENGPPGSYARKEPEAGSARGSRTPVRRAHPMAARPPRCGRRRSQRLHASAPGGIEWCAGYQRARSDGHEKRASEQHASGSAGPPVIGFCVVTEEAGPTCRRSLLFICHIIPSRTSKAWSDAKKKWVTWLNQRSIVAAALMWKN
jgi:hypothetical protein